MQDGEDEVQALRARRDAARARRLEAETQRDATRQSSELARQVEEEERAALEEEKLAELESEHGELGIGLARVVTARNGSIFLKKPHHLNYRRFNERSQVKLTTEECERFVFPTIVYPDKSTATRIFEDEPAAIYTCANAGAALCGAGKEELQGKS